MTSAQARPQKRNGKKHAAEGFADGVLGQAVDGVVEITGQLMTGAAQAVSGIVEVASVERLKGGGGDFGGGGATGEWELPSISLPDIGIDF